MVNWKVTHRRCRSAEGVFAPIALGTGVARTVRLCISIHADVAQRS
jgi:hypothetical protein